MKGSCNCTGITFEVAGAPQIVSFAHSGPCQKQSGCLCSSTIVGESQIIIRSDVFRDISSKTTKSGFCRNCRAFLFWKHNDETTLSFALRAKGGPTGLRLEEHIFVTGKGDFCQIAGDVPQKEN